jgi:Ca2+-binding RTX toxin-like protein
MAITGLSISDVDVGAGNETVTLAVTNGALTLAGTAGLSFAAGDGSADTTMTFSGTVGAINAALNGLIYAPTANFNGGATLTITTNDNGNTGSGGALSDTDAMAITVTPVIDAPLSAAGVNVSLATGIGSGGDAQGDTLFNFENLRGSDSADVLAGDSNANVIEGLGGADTLIGGFGNDTFVFNAPFDGIDTITDFEQGSDGLRISAAGFGGGLVAGGTVTIHNVADAASFSGPAGGHFIFEQSALNQGTLYWDANGEDGIDAVELAIITGVGAMAPPDFQIV